MKNDVIKGSVFIALGAFCYGTLATFVKLAYKQGFTTAEVTLSQFILGFAGLFILSLFSKSHATPTAKKSGFKSTLHLIFAGSSLGLTSIFYYMAVKYIPVSVAIVLLMQTVWMGVILETLIERKPPGFRKIVSVAVILCGTILSTNLLKQSGGINWPGFGWGILAAITYTATMYSSNNVQVSFPHVKRSMYMILGGLIVIALIFHSSINLNFSFRIFLSWGFPISLFGTFLPPLLFTKGMPLTGVGLGAIITSLEIPVSVMMAYFILNEPVSTTQWIGILLILFAVFLMNFRNRNPITDSSSYP